MSSVVFCDEYSNDAALVCGIHEAAETGGSFAANIFQVDTPLAAEKRLPRFVKKILSTIKSNKRRKSNRSDMTTKMPMMTTMYACGLVVRRKDGSRVPGSMNLTWSPCFPEKIWVSNDHGVGYIAFPAQELCHSKKRKQEKPTVPPPQELQSCITVKSADQRRPLFPQQQLEKRRMTTSSAAVLRSPVLSMRTPRRRVL